jgi:hypothetical protein
MYGEKAASRCGCFHFGSGTYPGGRRRGTRTIDKLLRAEGGMSTADREPDGRNAGLSA